MSSVIIREYKELLDKLQEIELKITTLPSGYISEKTISGKKYYYLQCKENGKVKSKYLKKTELENIKIQLEMQKQYIEELPSIKNRLKELEQASKLLDKALYRKLIVLKMSNGMDNLSVEQKEQSISFASAINSIEGVPLNSVTNSNIESFKNGDKTFLDLFQTTLRQYGFTD